MAKAQTDPIVNRAVRVAQRRGMRIALTGYLIFFAGIVAERQISAGEANDAREAIVQSGTAVAVTACNERFRDRRSLRAVLIASRNATRASKDISDERRKASEAFFNDRLSKLPLPDCRSSLTVLSDDPNAKVKIPKPLFLPDQKKDRNDEERDQKDDGNG
jgi:hypothetical protein